jgi:hypothetical protein
VSREGDGAAGGEPLFHDRAYFDDRFAGDPDPWGFDRRWYERRKHTLTVAALPAPRYRRGGSSPDAPTGR